jgi:uncharacterized protein YjdB
MKKLSTLIILLFACLLSSTAFAQITGPTSVCAGANITLSGSPSGGGWTSSNTAVATVGTSSGIVHGVTAGTAMISYSTWPTGVIVTVNPNPTPILGSDTVLCGSTLTLTDATAGGTWTSGTPSIATVGATTGIVSPVTYGATFITYTLPTGCYTFRAKRVESPFGVTISGASTASGVTTMCVGDVTTLTGTPSGGTWSGGTGVVASITSSGVVTALTAGYDSVLYHLSTPCGTITTMHNIYVVTTPPTYVISGAPTTACGATTTLTCATGGTWSSSNTAVATITSTTGIVTGVSAGTTTISYTLPAMSCGTSVSTRVQTVSAASAGTISGTATICVGSTTSLSSTVSGGVWSTTSPSISIGSTTGVATGISAGTGTVTYTVSSACGTATAIYTITVSATGVAGAIGGPSTLTCGGSGTKTCSPSGGTWSSSTPAVATISATTGVMSAVSPGTTTITYTVSTSCGVATTTAVVTVTPSTTTTVTATASAVPCSSSFYGAAMGASSYTWTPGTGLSCTACGYPIITPTGTTTYTVTGTSTCGTGTTTVTVVADRIKGNITFSSATPSSPTLRVWLIQYNPTDSSIVATDSVLTCLDSLAGTQYYSFPGKPAGNYLVKAKLLSSVAGSSGYIPTYGASTANWFSATNIAHTAGASNTQNINMIYGTVPSGIGFISGYVYAGAGKGTSTGVPNMLIYLKNATTGQVLTYTYTDGGGAYSFNGLSNGSYIIYPEDYGFYTTPSGVITLTNASSGATGVIFNQYALKGTIEPATVLAVNAVDGNNAISIHPNPTSGTVHINWQNQATGNGTITITDVAGREVYRSSLNIHTVSGEQTISLDKLNSGIYIINVKSEGVNYNEKLMLNK